MVERFDAIVVGAGAGGMTVAVGLAGLGRRVALIESSRVGGDCTNTGCIPSKRLIHLARHEPSRPSDQILADVRATRDSLAGREHRELEQVPGISLVVGTARIRSRSEVAVTTHGEERRFVARNIVIASGSRPVLIPVPGLPDHRLLTNERIFELERRPEHLAIVGAGAIGLELAAAFRRLGSRVTLVDLADRVLAPAIPEASAAVADTLAEQGIRLLLSSRTTRYHEPTRTLHLATPTGPASAVDVDAVMIAVGRTPNIDDLGLEELGVRVDRGIVVDRWGRTSVRGIWAVGDATRGSSQTHAAAALARRVVQRIALPWLSPLNRPPIVPSAVFCEPEVAWVGMTADEIARRLHPNATRTITVAIAETDRGLTDDARAGFLSVTVRRFTGRVIAATIVGPSAPEIVEVLAQAIERRTSLARLSRRAYAYPTFTSIVGRAGDEFVRRTFASPRQEFVAFLRYRRLPTRSPK